VMLSQLWKINKWKIHYQESSRGTSRTFSNLMSESIIQMYLQSTIAIGNHLCICYFLMEFLTQNLQTVS
jgi:hypothetical protein